MKEPKKQYGVLFRVPAAEQAMAVLLCVRKEKAWDRNPLQVSDARGSYGNLGPEQMQLVEVMQTNGDVQVRDIIRVGLTAQDKAPGVLQAIQAGIFFELAESILKTVLRGALEQERHKSAQPLRALDGTATAIFDSWLRERYEPQKNGHEVYDVDEIKVILANMIYQQALDARLPQDQPGTPEQKLERKLEAEATARAIKERFERFVQPMQKGDEYWFFRSDPVSLAARSGQSGYLILRERKVVASYSTRLA